MLAPPAPRRPIRALPALVVNQIAAGEVVERPASVVKELVENALDAGATRIVVELERGGIELVRVGDDGSGIPADQLPAALAPHSTSKLEGTADLERIATMGFRGEALASIASVSRLTIRSRTPDSDAAWEVSSTGSDGSTGGAEVRPAAGPVGTTVEVRNLFYNTPARRKFLRTEQTERSRCAEAVEAQAMARPAVGFTLIAEGRKTLDLPAGQSPRERVLGILGRELDGQYLEAHADQFDDARGVALWGLVGLPAVARPTNKAQYVFVNGRPIRDRSIQHALQEAYRGLLEGGRYPSAVLILEMDPGAVDVNVHPTKAEVRFRDPSLVHSVVLGAVRQALRGADLTPRLGPGAGVRPGEERAIVGAGDPSFAERFQRPAPGPDPTLSFEEIRRGLEGARPAPAPASRPRAPGPAPRVLQVHNSYLITQDEQGVLIVDQHALHERVMFEQLMARVSQGPLESQRLLAPEVVAARPSRVDRLAELKPLFERLGIEAEPIGPGQVAVHAFPTFLFDKGVEPGAMVGELLEKAEADGFAPGGEAALRDILDMMACKAAVKAGDRMNDEELATLMEMRESVERSSNCPHGRPTTVRLSIRELERLFHRA